MESFDFKRTSVFGEFTLSEIVRLQSACRMSLHRRRFVKLRISIPSTISAGSTKQYRCTLHKFTKSSRASIESKKIQADVRFVDLGTLPSIVVCMANDTSSSSTSHDHSSPVCIALFDGSSCSYSKKRQCVRFDVVFYKSLETNIKFVEIMSVKDKSFRLYIDLGSTSENVQFTVGFLKSSSLPIPDRSLSWWSSKTDAETNALYDCLAGAFNVTGKCSLLPNKTKLVDSKASPSKDCCSSGRLSRCDQFTLFLLYDDLPPSTI
jgi:hypothetical protein